jgi:oligopeptide/dipeptide ABC transporter ATP-binding protein
LLAAVPSVKGKRQRLESVKGTPPNLADLPVGCKFAPRCPTATAECLEKEPELLEVRKNHFVRCFYADKGAQ